MSEVYDSDIAHSQKCNLQRVINALKIIGTGRRSGG